MRMLALYTDGGSPVLGLTLAQILFTVKSVKKSDNSVLTPVNAQAAIAEVGGGLYLYEYAGADPTLYNYAWYAQYTGATEVDGAYVYGESDVEGEVLTVNTLVSRVLGLVQENQYIDNTTFDVDNHMLTARLRTYTDAVSVGTAANVLATYDITATYDVNGDMVTFKVVKV